MTEANGAERVQQFFRELTLPDWPVYGLAGAPGAWVSHAAEDDGGLTGLTVAYRVPTDHQRLLVRTALVTDRPGDLGTLVAWVRDGDLDEQPPPSRTTEATTGVPAHLTVDSRPVDGQFVRAGDAGVVRCTVGAVHVTVLVRGAPPGTGGPRAHPRPRSPAAAPRRRGGRAARAATLTRRRRRRVPVLGTHRRRGQVLQLSCGCGSGRRSAG